MVEDASSKREIRLNIGCGRDIKPGWLNCDLFPGEGVDLVFNASKSLPLKDESVSEIYMSHVLEHILNWEDLVYECSRLLKIGGNLILRVPYGVTFNPYHVRFFMPETMDMFCVSHLKGDCRQFTFEKPLFKMHEKKILRVFWLGWHLNRYLHISFLNGKRYTMPFGKKYEILWSLEKIGSIPVLSNPQ